MTSTQRPKTKTKWADVAQRMLRGELLDSQELQELAVEMAKLAASADDSADGFGWVVVAIDLIEVVEAVARTKEESTPALRAAVWQVGVQADFAVGLRAVIQK